MHYFQTFAVIILTALLTAMPAIAGAPTAMNYQGLLTDNVGNPVTDSTYSVTFTIYDAAAVGNSKWTETQNVTTTDGLFSVLLGSVNPVLDTVFSGTTRYLGIAVAGDPEIAPRTALVSVPYAQRVSTVDGASGGNITSKVGIGTTSPLEQLSVFGKIVTQNATGSALYTEASTASLGADTLGTITTFGPNGNRNVRMTALVANPDNGFLGISNSNGKIRAGVFVADPDGRGTVFVADSTGFTRGLLNADGGSDGHFTLWSHNGNISVDISNSGDLSGGGTGDDGIINVLGDNGLLNVTLGSFSPSFQSNGAVNVYNSSNVAKAGIHVDAAGMGVVFGDLKPFVESNPAKPGTDIWYCSLEGPEAAAYVRGTASLVNGSVTIDLPDHFTTVASDEGLTVQVTSHSATSLGLAVVERSASRIVVREMANGTGSYSFDYHVTAVRERHKNWQVVRPSMEVAERNRISTSKKLQPNSADAATSAEAADIQ